MRRNDMKIVAAIFALLVSGFGQGATEQREEKTQELTVKTISKSVTIGGQLRARMEYRSPLAYTNKTNIEADDDIYLLRTRLSADFSANEKVRVFIQVQDSRQFGQETSVASNDNLVDLHQGFADISHFFYDKLSLRAGRFEMSYGDQRMISPLDWSNTGRAWDGARLRFTPNAEQKEKHWIDIFATVIKTNTNPPAGVTVVDEKQAFLGIYGSHPFGESLLAEMYALSRSYTVPQFTDELGRKGDFRDTSLGTRWKYSGNPLTVTFEFVYQWGSVAKSDIEAFATALDIRCDLVGSKVGFEHTLATGDRDPTDGNRETFDPPFTFAHSYQGLADVFAWKNGQDFHPYFICEPAKGWTLQVGYHLFSLMEAADSWYAASGSPIRTDATGGSGKQVGSEIDIHAKTVLHEKVKLWYGISYFIAGNYVQETADLLGLRDKNMLWFFFQMTIDL